MEQAPKKTGQSTDQATFRMISDGLRSGQVEQQISALEQATALVRTIADAAVAAFESSSERYLIFERLPMLGSAVVKPLSEAYSRATNDEVRVLAALVLLEFGVHVGVPALVSAVSSQSSYACLSAQGLARHQLPCADEVILGRLAQCSPEEVDLVVCLLDALHRIGRAIPEDILTRVTSGWPQWRTKGLALR